MADTTPARTFGGLRVLVAGGGVAALETIFALRALAGDLVDIELLAPEPLFFYRPLAVAEPFGGPPAAAFELAALAEAVDAGLTLGELASVSPDAHVARTSHGMAIEYDALVVACGVSPRTSVRGAVTFRGSADSDKVRQIAERARAGEIGSVVFAVATTRTWLLPSYELAFGLRGVAPDVEITVSTAEPAPLAILGRRPSAAVADALRRARIGYELGIAHGSYEADVVVAAPEVEGRRVLGLPADDDGFVATNRNSAVHGVPGVYAVGDITSYGVRQGSIAAAQADAAASALAARAGAGVEPEPFRPVLRAAILALGETIYARRDLADPRDEGTVSREPLWSPPAKIAARHLAPALAGALA
jgi:sulfide:quinone oxidoreductase